MYKGMEEVSFLQKAITDIKGAIVIKIIFKIQIPYLYYKGINIGRNSFYFFLLISFAFQVNLETFMPVH